MRVFVTGATGFIGSAIVPELITAGHHVLGMARSDEGATALVAAGAEVQRGTLEDLESVRNGAANSDGVIHAAFNHDFSKFAANCEADRLAIEALGSVLEGSNRPLLVTGGLGFLAQGRLANENDQPPPVNPNYPRASEHTAAALAARGVNASVVRLPQVHDRTKFGLITWMIDIARQRGVSAYVGDGQRRYAAAHVLDVARLYRLVLEKGVADARYHAVAEEGIFLRDVAEAIGKGLKIPVVSITPEEASSHFGFLGAFMSIDIAASSTLTQEGLGWHPTGPGLITDLEQSTEFEA